MNSSLPALEQCPPVCPPGEPCSATQSESSEANPNRAALLGFNGRPAPGSLTDLMVTGAVESATIRAQTDLTNRFQTLCTNDDGDTVATLLSRMSEAEVSKWLDTPLHFSEFNDTPMIYVARHNCVSIASLLLTYNANPVKPNPYSETGSHPLFIAAQENRVEVIHLMSTADGFDPDAPRSDGHNALSVAILKENQAAVKALLECKADPNYKISAVYFNGSLQSVKCLPENGTAGADRCWLTMINSAARIGSPEILKLLLSHRGSPDNVDPGNRLQKSPLLAALSENTNKEVIRLLLAYGADMHERIAVNPFDWAGITEEKINNRPTLCQFACATMSVDWNKEILELFHLYYRTKDGKKIPFEKFHGENFAEGYCRMIATSDCFFEQVITMPWIHVLLPSLVSFLQKKMTKTQISCSGLNENQAKILENLSEEKTRKSLIQLKNVTPRKLQEVFLHYFVELENDGITMAQDADKNRESIDEFLQEGTF